MLMILNNMIHILGNLNKTINKMEILSTITKEQILNVLLIFCVSILFYIIYWYGYGRFQFFKKLGIPGPPADFFVGNTVTAVRKYSNFYEQLDEWIKTYKQTFGIYFLGLPTYVVTDTDMLKEIFIGKFDYFRDRMAYLDRPYPYSLMLGWSKGEVWKHMRTNLTPLFSPNKLKSMTGIFIQSADTCLKLIQEKVKKNENVDVGEIARGFSAESILSAAFGLEGKSESDANKHIINYGNSFFERGSALHNLCFWLPYSGYYIKYYPGGRLKSMKEMFKNVMEIVCNRKKDTEKHNDLLQFMVDSQSKATGGLTDIEICSSATNFMANGQETIGTTLTACLFELTKNQSIQEKVYEEIKNVLGSESPSSYTAEQMEKMVYLEQVLNETLRLYPAAPMVIRSCNKDITIKGIQFKQDTYVTIPVYTIQRNSEAYEKPEEFYPEHFNEDAVKSRHPCFFLPFGNGPRKCLGYKFAMLEMKIAISSILKNFKLELIDESPKVLQFEQKMTMLPVGAIPVKALTR